MKQYMVDAKFPTKENSTNELVLGVDAPNASEAMTEFFRQFTQQDFELPDDADISITVSSPES